MNNLISREAATTTVSYRFAVVASRLATRRATIPTAYAVGYMLSSLRDCEMAQLLNAQATVCMSLTCLRCEPVRFYLPLA